MDELQALVTGMLIGALLHQQHLEVVVEPTLDENGNYEPEFLVTGRKSGTRLRVTVDVIGEEEDASASQDPP